MRSATARLAESGAVALLALAGGAGPAWAQDARPVGFATRVDTVLTATSNYALTPQAESDVIAEVRPGVSVRLNGSRVKGALDYSLAGVAYARHSQSNRLQNSLSGSGSAELIENRLSFEAQASVSRQSLSALGPQDTSGLSASANSNDVGNVSFGPVLKGALSSTVLYEARVVRRISRVRGQQVGDGEQTQATARLSGGAPRLGWALDAARDEASLRLGRHTSDDRLFGTLRSSPDVDVQLSVRAGRESSDITTLNKTSHTLWGASAAWTPTPRTQVSLDVDKRYYGKSHTFLVSHRLARTAFQYSDSASAYVSNDLRSATLYDLYSAVFASTLPDPVARDAYVRGFIASQGLDPNASTGLGFQTSAVSLTRARQLSASYAGLRTTATVMASVTDSERLDTLSTAPDDLAGNFRLRQGALMLLGSHQLTPQDSVQLGVTWRRALGDSARQGSNQTTLSAGWSTRLGVRTSLGADARRTVSSGASRYNETGLAAHLSLSF